MAEIIVAIGSTNRTKVLATESVFTSQFVGIDEENCSGRRIPKNFARINVSSYEIESAVSSTPKSDDESIKGAIYRAKAALKRLQEENPNFENSEYFGAGLEAGYSHFINPETEESSYFLCTWGAVIHQATGKISFGCSAKAPFSGELLKRMRNDSQQREMKQVLAEASGIKEIATQQGGIHLLTDGHLTRQQLNEQALHCALAHFVSPSCIH